MAAVDAGFSDFVRPEFPSCIDVVGEMNAGVYVFETVCYETAGPYSAGLAGLT